MTGAGSVWFSCYNNDLEEEVFSDISNLQVTLSSHEFPF